MDKGDYLRDLVKCFVSFGIRGVNLPLLSGRLEQVIAPNVNLLDSKTTENFLFYL